MRILTQSPNLWFLAEEDGTLYMDVYCTHGAAGFSVLARLTPAEATECTTAGEPGMERVAAGIRNGGPFAFEKRDVGPEIRRRFSEAMKAWHGSRPG